MSSSYKPPERKDLEIQYRKRVPSYEQLIEEICYIITKGLRENGIAASNIESRVKSFDSFYDKMIREEIKGDVFEEIEDIAGIRILCPYRSDLERVEATIRNKLKVLKANIMRSRTDLVFGYMSDHYLVKIPYDYKGERYDSIKSLKCEIQVRTVAMHAWATVSHQLEYKQEIDIPSELKNDFYALSGVFYIADSLFAQFKNAREKSLRKLTKDIEQSGFSLDGEVNLDTMKAYLAWKFPDRKEGMRTRVVINAISALISEMQVRRIESFRELEHIIDSNMKWFLEHEKNKHKERYFRAVGVARVILHRKVPISR